MKEYLLPNGCNSYKANLHVHTTVSDGKLTPEETKEVYKSAGYSIVAFTDHQIMLPHPELCDDEFIAITSTELAANKGSYMLLPSTHINIYAKNPNACTYPYFRPEAFWDSIAHTKEYLSEEAKKFPPVEFKYGAEDINKIIEACNEQGYLVCYNHPVNSLEKYDYYGQLKGLWGVECFNSGCYLNQWYEDTHACDDLNRLGERKAFPIAADDAHSLEACCIGYIMLKAPKLEYSAVMEALEKGDFYASTGIEIKELYIQDETVYISTDGVDEIVLSSSVRFLKGAKSNGKPITSWSCDLSKLFQLYRDGLESNLTNDAYFRIDLKRNDGKEAHTRAFFLDMLC